MKLTDYDDFEIGDYIVVWEQEYDTEWRFFALFRVLSKSNYTEETFDTTASFVWVKDSGDTKWIDDTSKYWDEISICVNYCGYEILAWKLTDDEIERHVVMEQI